MSEENPTPAVAEESTPAYRQIDPQTGVVSSAGSRAEAAEAAREARENSN